jgi:tetratricopeptide (TPR) repeat protein
MFELKPIHQEAIPNALKKAELYRLLNEPEQAESICYDILQVDPNNQRALITLLLALTDQFERGLSINRSQDLLPRLHGEYERAYYAGIIYERKGRAQLTQAVPGAKFVAYELFREAMFWYERAEALRPPDNDDATLRWNACVRSIKDQRLEPRVEEKPVVTLE